jgi:hypothetical protein
MDPAPPGHQPSSEGLLPAFNGNTKPFAGALPTSFCAAVSVPRPPVTKPVEARDQAWRVASLDDPASQSLPILARGSFEPAGAELEL